MTPYSVFQFSSPAPTTPKYDPDAIVKKEFGRIIHAAIINSRFRETLLKNPVFAIENGYLGECFQLSSELKERIQLIQAGTLEEFSSQILSISNPSKIQEMAMLQY
jgi:hypothetical protein